MPAIDPRIQSLLEAMRLLEDESESSLRGMLLEKLSRLTDSDLNLLRGIETLQRNGPHQYKFLYTILGEQSDQLVREVLFFRPLINDRIDQLELIDLINGLHRTDRFKGHERMEQLTGDDLEAAIAFMHVTDAIHKYADGESLNSKEWNEENERFISDRDLHDLIAAHTDKADSIRRFIRDRRTGSAALISAFIESTTPLKQGVL